MILNHTHWQVIATSDKPGVWAWAHSFDSGDVHRWISSGTMIAANRRRVTVIDGQERVTYELIAKLPNPPAPPVSRMAKPVSARV